jgi:rare lipoprotein A
MNPPRIDRALTSRRWPWHRRWYVSTLALCAAVALSGCGMHRYEDPKPGTSQRGVASWYGEPFHGRATASGEIYDMHGLTAAHRQLPLGTVVAVRSLENGKQVTVRINDRGPFAKGRILDLSYAAARKLDMIGPGTMKIELTVVEMGRGKPGPTYASRYTVQVGAFQDRANAERLLQQLRGAYPDAVLIVDGPWHRVRVGDLRDEADAEALRRDLERQGHRAIVVALD